MPMCLCLLSGIPASGKTSFARRISSSLSSLKIDHLNYDDFIQPEVAYTTFRKNMLDKIENFARESSEQQIVLIVDDNMNYRSMRKEVYNLARKRNLGYFQIFFKTSLKTALERNKLRQNPLPEETLVNLSLKMEDPSQDQDVDTIIFDTDSNQELDFQLFYEKALFHLENREKLPEVVKVKHHQSDLHKIDLILRREISRKVKEASDKEAIKSLSAELNNRRKIILKNFRESGESPESIDDVRNLLLSIE